MVNINYTTLHPFSGSKIRPVQLANTGSIVVSPRLAGYRSLIESMRVMLAIIFGLLILDNHSTVEASLPIGVFAFCIYSIILLWMAASGSTDIQRPVFNWIDALWLFLLLSLAGATSTHYFLFLFFPVFIAVWRTGYRESIAIATFCGLASLFVYSLRYPDVGWMRLLTLPLSLSLFMAGQFFVALARAEAATRKSQALAASIIEGLNSRRGFDAIIGDLVSRIAGQSGASSAILAIRTLDGDARVYRWESKTGSSELNDRAAVNLAEQALSLSGEGALSWSSNRHWWMSNRQISIKPSDQSLSFAQKDRSTPGVLPGLVLNTRFISVPFTSAVIGHLRLILAGDAIDTQAQSIKALLSIVKQISPSVENAYLRELLAKEAADSERARIGRDLHDSAIQPYIGLKFAIEAVQRHAGSDNPVAADLAQLVAMVSDELASMRGVVSSLRGAPGQDVVSLSSAVQRQAARFALLFGIQVNVEVEGEMAASRRIAGEIFHIVAEGLSNIRRHTQSRQASISLRAVDHLLLLSISNTTDAQAACVADFTPLSLSERAAALGGSVTVGLDESTTTVTVRVPMPSRNPENQP